MDWAKDPIAASFEAAGTAGGSNLKHAAAASFVTASTTGRPPLPWQH